MDEVDRAQLYEQAALEAALSRQQAERQRRRYVPADNRTCVLCGGHIESLRQAWSDHCASCAADEERWSRR